MYLLGETFLIWAIEVSFDWILASSSTGVTDDLEYCSFVVVALNWDSSHANFLTLNRSRSDKKIKINFLCRITEPNISRSNIWGRERTANIHPSLSLRTSFLETTQ